jgi:hypothetical protein
MLVQTLCPTWDQTLIFENIPIYGNVEEVQKDPPHVVMEFFDRDAVVSFFIRTALSAWLIIFS